LDLLAHAVDAPNVDTVVKLQQIMKNTDYSSGKGLRAAMGYSGAFMTKALIALRDNHKYHDVNQTKWLFDHSGMRIPSGEVFQKSYVEGIVQGDGNYRLGRYQDQSGAKKNV
jgi:hypothetical protein